MQGAEVLTRFKADTKDFDKGVSNAKGGISGLTKALVEAQVITKALEGSFRFLTNALKSSVNAYASVEQSVGGSKLLFGDSFNYIEEKSKQAFKTAGLSVNGYLEQVNGFAVGLKDSMGGNTQAAAELADKIITAEADIVAATGRTQEAVQNAFNGVMRGNYVMLDNLQLGIKPTKEGLQEVIDKVNEWNATNGKATSYVMGNYADMEAALVDYVEMQGLAGYAASEASTTITGSVTAAKAAWENFLSGQGGIEQVIETFITAGTNIANAIIKMLPQIVTGVVGLLKGLLPMLPQLLKAILPGLLTGAIELTKGIIAILPDLILMIAEMLPTMLPEIVDAITEIVPMLIQMTPLFIKAGAVLLGAILEGIVRSIPSLLSGIKNVANSILGVFREVPGMLWDIGVNIVKGLWNGMAGIKDWVISKVRSLGKSILNGLKSVLGIHSPSKEFAIVGRYSILGYTEALDNMQSDVQKQIAETFALSPQLSATSGMHFSPNIINNNYVDIQQDPLGQMVNNIKTYAGGSRNDYNYGQGVS